MKKSFILYLVVLCYTASYAVNWPSLISVNDSSIADWNNLPSEYVFSTVSNPESSMGQGLKSVKVYADYKFINILVELNKDSLMNKFCIPFHVFIDVDNSNTTGGTSSLFAAAGADFMMEHYFYYDSISDNYDPSIYRWWGKAGESGWQWTDPAVPHSWEDNWGAILGSDHGIGKSQNMIVDQIEYTEIQLLRERMPFNVAGTFQIGFDLQDKTWNRMGLLPNEADADTVQVLAPMMRVTIDKTYRGASVEVDGLTYQLYDHTATLVRAEAPYSGDIVIPDSIQYDDLTYAVTQIGNWTFGDCKGLTSITIPATMKCIDKDAFYGCDSLKAVYISSLKAWCAIDFDEWWANPIVHSRNLIVNGTEVSDLVIPDGVTEIKDYAFANCNSLKTVIISELVTKIGEQTFNGCHNLTGFSVSTQNPNYTSKEGVLFNKDTTVLI